MFIVNIFSINNFDILINISIIKNKNKKNSRKCSYYYGSLSLQLMQQVHFFLNIEEQIFIDLFYLGIGLSMILRFLIYNFLFFIYLFIIIS